MIKLIACDLDQTIVFTGNIHFESLNKALSEASPEYVISKEDHDSVYNGLPSKKKLEMLVAKGLPAELTKEILNKKQQYTEFFVRKLICKDDYKQQRDCLSRLKDDGYLLACCSNAIKSSVHNMLECSVGTDLFDIILSNEEVTKPKPDKEIYVLAAALANVNNPREVVVVEDSLYGIMSGTDSGAFVVVVKDPFDFSYDFIKGQILEIEKCQI